MKRSYVVVATILAAAPLAAQEPAAIGGVKLTGFVEVSYAYSSRRVGDTAIVGRLYDRLQNRFMLNALALVLDKPHDPAKYSAGFHGELLFGQNASVIKSGGFNFSEHGDIPHLYVTLNIPTASGNGLQLKAGRIPTLLGLEVIETIANPNWSVGNQFVYVENFTALGLSVETKFSPHVDAQLRIINGWDQVSDNNHRKSLMGRVGIYPDSRTSLGIVGYWGPEQPNDDTAARYGVEALIWRKLGKVSLWIQGDYGREQANAALPDPTQDARWSAAGAWVTYDVNAALGLALRGDYVNDANGARSSGVLGYPSSTAHDFASATATFNIRAWPDALLRPELRYDHSSMPSFDGAREQVSFAISLAYLF